MPVLAIIAIVGVFMALTLISNSTKRNKRRLPLRKSDRKNSFIVRTKKKTDEWVDDDAQFAEEDYCDYIPQGPSADDASSPLYYRDNLHRAGSEKARLRKSFVATDASHLPLHSYRGQALQGFDAISDSMTELVNKRRQIEDLLKVEDVEMPMPSPPRNQLPIVSVDEEMPSPCPKQLPPVSVDEETPITKSKILFADQFADPFAPTLPNLDISLSRSVSDGNVKDYDDGISEKPQVDNHDSGETEGANGVLHKRRDLTAWSDAASSLHSPIPFSELKMAALIGGGGFGQVWSATWRGTPVAVKLLSAQSQAQSVQKAILQEFAAEINMLSGMRHPNICLYIGACLDPSHRAIVTGKCFFGTLG